MAGKDVEEDEEDGDGDVDEDEEDDGDEWSSESSIYSAHVKKIKLMIWKRASSI